MYKRAVLCSLALCSLGTAVAAQQVNYGNFGLSYGINDLEGESVNVLSGNGEIGITSGQMDFWVSGGATELQADSLPDVELRALSFGAGYDFGNGLRTDLSYNDVSVGVSGLALTLSFFELGVGYDQDNFFGRVGYAHIDNDLVGIDDIVSVMGGYRFTQSTTATLSAHVVDEQSGDLDTLYIATAEHDAGRWRAKGDLVTVEIADTRLNLFNAAMEYDLSDTYAFRGSYNRAEVSGASGHLDKLSVGIGYQINPRTQAFADIAALRANDGFDTATGQSITFGVSMDLGSKPAAHQTTSDRLRDVFGNINAVRF